MDANKCHIFLRRPSQYDIDTTHKERENIYVFTWRGKRVAMRPIPAPPESTKKKVSLLISLGHQLDRNSRVSSFEEEGTDVGELGSRLKFIKGPGGTPGRSPGRPGNMKKELINNRDAATVGRPIDPKRKSQNQSPD